MRDRVAVKPWPHAPDWMDAWDGKEPLLVFIRREGPVVDVTDKHLQVFEDDPPLTPERRAAYEKIVKMGTDMGVIVPVCVCNPKRSEPHACPINPDDAPWLNLLRKL